MTAPRVGALEVIELLERARIPGPSGLAFDADGTLCSGDVGEDVFEFAYGNDLLREEAREELSRVARAHGLSDAGSASDLARSLHAAYRRGALPERLTCELMTWSYAGFTSHELRELAPTAVTERKLAEIGRPILRPPLEIARR